MAEPTTEQADYSTLAQLLEDSYQEATALEFDIHPNPPCEDLAMVSELVSEASDIVRKLKEKGERS